MKGSWYKPPEENHFCLYLGGRYNKLLKCILIQIMLAFDFTQLDSGALPSAINGSAFPSGSTLPGPPPKITLAG